MALTEAVRDDERLGPTYRVRDKIFALPRPREGRPVVSLKAPAGSQEVLLGADPGRFFHSPYVGRKGWIGMWLDEGVDWDEVARLTRRSWACIAPKRLAATLEEMR